MGNKYLLFITASFSGIVFSCSPSINISKYYFENKTILDSVEEKYKILSQQYPFSIEFTDRSFKNVSIEIYTDSLKYIYEFAVEEKRMTDTLVKYHLPVKQINILISEMTAARCTWINKLDYYVDTKKEYLVFMSFRAKYFNVPFTNKKYYILTYFLQPQYYDEVGRLLDHRSRKKIRKINEDVFRRITDKVAYSISDRFR